MIGAAINTILNKSPKAYPLTASQGKTFPVTTYQVISDTPVHDMNANAGVRKALLQINVSSLTYDEAETIINTVISKLDRVKGTYSSVIIADIRHQETGDLFSEDAEVFGKYAEFLIWYKQ